MSIPRFSHLNGYKVNLALLQENANNDFIELLERVEGSKVIAWDLENIYEPVINLMIDASLLQDIKNTKIQPGSLNKFDVKNVIFITRPEIQVMDYIAENITKEFDNKQKQKTIRKNYYLYFIPRRSEYCLKRLEAKNVLASFNYIGELKWDFFPIDKDLISMERDKAFYELMIEGDPTCLYEASLGLVNLQKIYGRIPKIYGKGNYAEKIWQYTKALGREEKSISNSDKDDIDQMIILDRSIDFMSVLITQLTYEGLIDENYGINQGIVSLPMDRFTKPNDERFLPLNMDEKKKVSLNSGEELFFELRNKNFNEVGVVLSKHANDISQQFDEKNADKSIREMRKFVEKLPLMMAKKQSVVTHTTIGEMIKEITDSDTFLDDLAIEQEFMSCMNLDKASSYIEDLIGKKDDFKKVIRLICIQCVAASGFKPKILDYYKRELVHVYGVEALLTISNLEKAGLFRAQTETRSYAVLKKTLNLTVEEVKEVDPIDISYVHSFYAPLTVRIIEKMLKPNGWQSVKNALNILPCASFDDFQAPLTGIGSGRRSSYTSEKSQSDTSKIILVFFVGGCTYAEIAALRFLSRQEECNFEFIIATTKIINKNSFIECFIEPNVINK